MYCTTEAVAIVEPEVRPDVAMIPKSRRGKHGRLLQQKNE